MHPKTGARRHDARVANADQFVSDFERQVLSIRPGEEPPHIGRVDSPDKTGTAWAVVDRRGRFVDLWLGSGWWPELGPARVGAGLLEALEGARTKVALANLVLQTRGFRPPHRDDRAEGRSRLPDIHDPGFPDILRTLLYESQDRIQEADRIRQELDGEDSFAGPRGIFRLVTRGLRIERAEVANQWALREGDGDRLAADARDALTQYTERTGR
jgi:hypothetical protein